MGNKYEWKEKGPVKEIQVVQEKELGVVARAGSGCLGRLLSLGAMDPTLLRRRYWEIGGCHQAR